MEIKETSETVGFFPTLWIIITVDSRYSEVRYNENLDMTNKTVVPLETLVI